MSFTWLTLRDIEYVVAVAEHAHFGRAAEACGVSQPAMSAQIRKVEGYLGTAVFERTKRKVALTSVGESIVSQARVVLAEAKKLTELARGRQEPLSGPFRLGAIATLGPYLMPHVLAPLRKRYPKAELLLREGLTDELIEELRAGRLDAVLASPTFAEDGLKRILLFDEPFVLVAPKEHPMARKASLRTSDLRPEDMVLLEDGHCLKDQALSICPANRRGSARKFHATSLETLRQLVASGLGYTLIPKLAAYEDPKLKGLLKYREFEGRRAGRAIALYYRGQYAYPGDMERLAEVIQESVPTLSGVSRRPSRP